MGSADSEPFTVCVFCASSEVAGAAERAVAADLGRAVAEEGWRLVYGGGSIGLMGEVARAALAAGGHVTGVIPHRLNTSEIALDDVTELVPTTTLRERKAIMDARSDAFCVLPGGIGTLEEFMEVLTLKQLGYHDRPIVLVDATGFWRPLRQQLHEMVERGLARPSLPQLWVTVTNVADAIAALTAPAPRPRRDPRAELETVEEPRPADAWQQAGRR